MTDQQIIDTNKVVAEYMDIPKCRRCSDCGGYQYSPAIIFMPAEMGYHKSWDWIMPVVRKMKGGISEGHFDIYKALNEVDLSATYQAVTEFIRNLNAPK